MKYCLQKQGRLYLKTLPECSTKVRIQRVPAGALGSIAACKSHTLKVASKFRPSQSLLSGYLYLAVIGATDNPLGVEPDAPDELLVPLEHPEAGPALDVPQADGVV